MFPIAFVIIFEKEIKECWGKSWNFVTHITHALTILMSQLLLISDQDTGSMYVIAEFLPNAHHFYCSCHHAGNIIKACCGEKKLHSGCWFFMQLFGS